jgi:hypothetical protein
MHCTHRALVLGLLALALAWPAAGGGLRGPYPSAPKGHVCDAPGSNFYPDYHPQQYPPYGRVEPAPAYAWGYFGARSKPFAASHSGYYRDYSKTIFPRGF